MVKLKPCPHCRRKVRLSENGDCRRIRRQFHFSATVWIGLNKIKFWLVHSLLLYRVFATRLILCFLSLHKQHFVTAHFQFITAYFVFHCTLKNALVSDKRLTHCRLEFKFLWIQLTSLAVSFGLQERMLYDITPIARSGRDTPCCHNTLHKAPSTLATIVADFGDCRRFRPQSPNSATVYCCRIRRQLPFSATSAEFGDKLSPFPRSPNSATVVAKVDRA